MVDKVISGNEKMRRIVDDSLNLTSFYLTTWTISMDSSIQIVDTAIKRKDEFGKEGLENLLRWTE